MKYISIIKSELGWAVILIDINGNPHLNEIKQWGVSLDGKITPLDNSCESYYRHNFLTLVDPNEIISDRDQWWKSICQQAKLKTAEPGWAESFVKSGT